MKRMYTIVLLSAIAGIIAITSGTGCKTCNQDDRRASWTIDTAMYVSEAPAKPTTRVDSAYARRLHENFMKRVRRGKNTGTIMDKSTADFTGAYTIQYMPMFRIAQYLNLTLYNGRDAGGNKVFVVVPSDKNFLIAPTDEKSCLLQDASGICPVPCPVSTLAPPTYISQLTALAYANAYYAESEPEQGFNAIQIDSRCITAFDTSKTKYLQMVWGYETFDSTYCIQLIPIMANQRQDHNQPIVSIQHINIVRQQMKL